MKLYRYWINYDNKFVCSEEDGFKEKPKTYYRRHGYPSSFRKMELGMIRGGIVGAEIWLTKRDDKKAQDMFYKYYIDMMDKSEKMHQESCRNYLQIIDSLLSS